MNRSLHLRPNRALRLLVVCALLVAPTRAQDAAPIGYRFRESPGNAQGVAELEDLRGRPVLVEFWGPRCPNCVSGAVPAALKLQETYGDDLQVLFVESQGAGTDAAEAFALGQKWLGGRSIWTSEVPFRVPGTTLPKFALLGADGRLVTTGNPLDLAKELERQIGEQIKLAKAPPAGLPLELGPAWCDFERARWVRAFERLDAVEVDPGACAERREAARALRQLFLERVRAQCGRVGRLITAGALDEAEERLQAIERALNGSALEAERVGALRARLAAPALAQERAACKAVAGALARFYASGGSPATVAELAAVGSKVPGTQAAQRAERAARLVRR